MLTDINQIQEWGDGKENVLWFKIWVKSVFRYISYLLQQKQLVIPSTKLKMQSDKVRHHLMRSVTNT